MMSSSYRKGDHRIHRPAVFNPHNLSGAACWTVMEYAGKIWTYQSQRREVNDDGSDGDGNTDEVSLGGAATTES